MIPIQTAPHGSTVALLSTYNFVEVKFAINTCKKLNPTYHPAVIPTKPARREFIKNPASHLPNGGMHNLIKTPKAPAAPAAKTVLTVILAATVETPLENASVEPLCES